MASQARGQAAQLRPLLGNPVEVHGRLEVAMQIEHHVGVDGATPRQGRPIMADVRRGRQHYGVRPQVHRERRAEGRDPDHGGDLREVGMVQPEAERVDAEGQGHPVGEGRMEVRRRDAADPVVALDVYALRPPSRPRGLSRRYLTDFVLDPAR